MKKKNLKVVIGVVLIAMVAAIVTPIVTIGMKDSKAEERAAESGALRIQASEDISTMDKDSLQDEIKVRLIESWGNWQPDYDGWVQWSDTLYAENAVINAIGGEQTFTDYQESMRHQREKASMKMGPIMNIVVEDHTAAITYHMYLTSKGILGSKTQDIIVTEYNTFEEMNGELMVTRLDLYTASGR